MFVFQWYEEVADRISAAAFLLIVLLNMSWLAFCLRTVELAFCCDVI